MRRAIALLLLFTFALDFVAYAGIPKDKSVYVGGTTEMIPKMAEGPMNTDDQKALLFKWEAKANSDKDKDKDKDKDSPPPATQWSLPYEKITSLAYGQHAGRRVGQTIAWGVTTLGIGALPILFSKKRRHYLTIEYTDDDGKGQAAVFEVGKEAIRTLLPSLQARTGKKIDYEDEEARKSGSK